MEQTATDTTISIIESLIKQFAQIKFDGALMYAVLMILAVIICLEGYGIYKAALLVIGFAVGYSHVGKYFDLTSFSDEKRLMIQCATGLVVAVLAGVFVKIGIFIAAYHFAQTNLSGIMVEFLAKQLNISEEKYNLYAGILGIVVAVIIAYLSMRAERLAVVVLTALVGGFAAVDFFMQMIPVFPIDVSFFDKLPEATWVVLKILLSAAGVGVQGVKEHK